MRARAGVPLVVVSIVALSGLALGSSEPLAPAVPRFLAAATVDGHAPDRIPGFALRGVTQPWRVGVQAGHLEIESLPDELARLRTSASTGAEWGSIREADINLSIARHLVAQLEAAGVVADLLPARVPPRYDADAIVSVHADGAWRNACGWKVASPSRSSPAARALRDVIAESYARVTGLPHDYRGVTRGMRGYFAFSPHRDLHAAAWTTPAMIVETGFVTQADDREFLLRHPEVAARGIAEGVLAYLRQREPAAVLDLAPSWFPQMRLRRRAELQPLPQADSGTGDFVDDGMRVYPLGRSGDWYEVVVRGGFTSSRFGWLPAAALERY